MPKYNELIKEIPKAIYDGIEDVHAHFRGAGEVLDDIDNSTYQARMNLFISQSDLPTIERLEAFFGIQKDNRRTLSDRQKLIMALINMSNSHFGSNEMKTVISSFTDGIINISFENSTFYIIIERDIEDSFLLTDCHNTLLDMIPGHLGLSIGILSEFESSCYVGGCMMRYKKEVVD